MWQLTTSAIIIIIFIALFTIVVPESEKMVSETIFDDADPDKDEIGNGHIHNSTRTSVVRCYRKIEIEIHFNNSKLTNFSQTETINSDIPATVRGPRRLSICEYDSDTRKVLSEESEETADRFIDKPVSSQVQISVSEVENKVKEIEKFQRNDENLWNSLVTSELSTQSNKFDIDVDVVERSTKMESANLAAVSTPQTTDTTIYSVEGQKPITRVPTLQLFNSLTGEETRNTDTILLQSTFPSITHAKREKLVLSPNPPSLSTTQIPSHLIDDKAVVSDRKTSIIDLTPPWKGGQMVDRVEFPEDISMNEKRSHPWQKPFKPPITLVDLMTSKIFHEIKPSLNSVMDMNEDVHSGANEALIPVTKRNFISDFKLPKMTGPLGKYGPYFIDELDGQTITERVGNTVVLDCRIGLLGDKKVTWLQHDKHSIRLLTVGNVQYSADERISLRFQYPNNWRLQITYATLRDSGLYKCQVEIDSVHSLVKRYSVVITAPILNITDDSGRPIHGERHLKAGSTLRLRCEGRDLIAKMNESLVWTRGDETITSDISENRTTMIMEDKEIPVTISTLIVERTSSRHAGNYTCLVPERARVTVAIHVLNGELPAAVHDGNGVFRPISNLWLVHLVVSYGLFR